MAEAPKYGFNPKPEFTVNHISEYLATDNAAQRTRTIRAAKFPKKLEVAAYAQIRNDIKRALARPDFDCKALGLLADKMAAKARRETGYQRDEALRCEKAVRAFMSTMRPRMFAQMKISSAPSTLSLKKWGVRLKVTMDASITLDDGGTVNSGGIVILYAFSADRGELKEHLSAITGLLLWALEGGQMEPLPRLCMAADIAEGKIVKASSSHTRFRQYVTDSCHEIAARWDFIEPPD